MVIGIPQKNWATELTNPHLLVDIAWNKIITTSVIFYYARDKMRVSHSKVTELQMDGSQIAY